MTKPTVQLPFEEVSVGVGPNGEALIEWSMNFCFPILEQICHFYIEFSHGGEWCRVNEEDIHDCMYLDQDYQRCGLGVAGYYRVVAVDAAGNEYASKPTSAGDCMSHRQYLLVRDILRKELLRLKTLEAGIACYLLKRRQHGPKCDTCLDHDLEQVVSSNCDVCYGTRFKGGYYNAIPFFIENSTTTSNKDVTVSLGTIDNKVRTVRAVAFPEVETYDLIVSVCGNKRFVVRQVKSVADVEFLPIVYNLTIMELPTSAVQFQVPLEQLLVDIHEDVSDKHTGGWDNDSITCKEVW
jgi:hypothetical protein